jgi:hypothetical protein
LKSLEFGQKKNERPLFVLNLGLASDTNENSGNLFEKEFKF